MTTQIQKQPTYETGGNANPSESQWRALNDLLRRNERVTYFVGGSIEIEVKRCLSYSERVRLLDAAERAR